MRALITIALALCIGCNEHGKHPAFDAVPDDAGSCSASGACAVGPACGVTCCGAGEHCVQGVCRCGANPACTNGDMCLNAGPGAEPPLHICGVICCGGPTPCPI
jgi:hypothetical protein